MTDLEQRLAVTFESLADEARHDPELLTTVRARTGRRWPSPRTTAVAATVAVVTIVGGGLALSGDDGSTPDPAAYSCPAVVPEALLPPWARTGFSGSQPKAPFVMGADGAILGVLFGQPLTAPESADHANKVLWVVKQDPGPLTIRARLNPGDEPVVLRSVTGPSYLDLPSPGCWHLDLAWGSHTDSLDVRVTAPTG